MQLSLDGFTIGGHSRNMHTEDRGANQRREKRGNEKIRRTTEAARVTGKRN